jgi:hypothetical protein
MSDHTDTDAGALLTPTIVEAIAQRVAELMRAELGLTPTLLTPTQVAERFAVSRTWVYEHADELGAIRLGQGPKARLRFSAQVVSQALCPREPITSEEERSRSATVAKKPPGGPPLLPIYGALTGQ